MSETTAQTGSLRVGWLELFYDLVYVTLLAAVTHLLHGEPSLGRMALVLGLLVVVWTVWFNEVQATNLARGLSPRHRIFVLASMAGVAVMAIGVPELVAGDYLTFVVGYALARVAIAPVWIDQQRLTGIDATRTALVGPLLVLAALGAKAMGHPGLFWAAAVVVELALARQRPRSRGGMTRAEYRAARQEQRRARRPHERPLDAGEQHFDSGHLLERIGLFVMLCFGESVAQLVAAMSEHRDAGRWLLAGLGLLLVGSLFWAFYDVALDRVEHALAQAPERLREVLGFGQIAVVAGILGVAAGLSGAVEHGSGHLPESTVRLLGGGVALAMLGLMSMSMDALRILITAATGAADAVTADPDPAHHRRGVGLLVLINLAMAVLAPAVVLAWGRSMPSWLVVVLLVLGPLAFVGSGSAGRRRSPDEVLAG